MSTKDVHRVDWNISRPDLGYAAWAIGDLIALGVTTLPAIEITARALNQSGLVWLLAHAHRSISDTGNWAAVFQTQILSEELNREVLDGYVQDHTTETGPELAKYALAGLGDCFGTLANRVNRPAPLRAFIGSLPRRLAAGGPLVSAVRDFAKTEPGGTVQEKATIQDLLHCHSNFESLAALLRGWKGTILEPDPLLLAMATAVEGEDPLLLLKMWWLTTRQNEIAKEALGEE